MTTTQPDRRKNRVVDAPQQARIVFGLTALPTSVLLLAAVTMWWLTNSLFDEAQQSNAELPSLGALVMTQYLFIVLTGAMTVWQAWRYSHRVIGPAQRIAKALRRLREGSADFRVDLRRGDALVSITDELNPLIAELQRRGTLAQLAADAAATTAAATTAAATEAPVAATTHGD